MQPSCFEWHKEKQRVDDIGNWILKTNVLDQLLEYLRKKSRSNYKDEVEACAKYAQDLLKEIGMEVTLIPTSGNPLILAEKKGSSKLSLLIYGHYDVQHEGDHDLWDNPPFEPVIRDGKIWGRGSADNKGQHFAHIKALEYFKSKFPSQFDELDIRFILDGDEERGSFSLAEVFSSYKDRLDADIMIVSDGPSLVTDKPTIVGSVRGILTFQILIQHNPEDLHSGNFGGLARSATLDLITLLSDLIDSNGYCKIPGFYDDVVPPTQLEKHLLQELEPVLERIHQQRGYTIAPYQDGRENGDLNQLWPTFNINGIQAGGVKNERRTIIPAEAVASIDCRLVPDMGSNRIKQLISDFLDRWAEDHDCKDAISVEFEHAMETLHSSLNSPHLEILKTALESGFGVPPVLVPRLGGSLPLYLFPEYLNREVFLIPYALPDENNHAPNENLDIEYFKNGIRASVALFKSIVS